MMKSSDHTRPGIGVPPELTVMFHWKVPAAACESATGRTKSIVQMPLTAAVWVPNVQAVPTTASAATVHSNVSPDGDVARSVADWDPTPRTSFEMSPVSCSPALT